MSWQLLKQSKKFGGKKYDLAGRYYSKADAEKKAERVRGYGKKVRISHEGTIAAPPWAVWAR